MGKSSTSTSDSENEGNDEEEEEEEGEEEEENMAEDDPDRLWCICRKPYDDRFMICCDLCDEWYHGECVGITKAMGRDMEKYGVDYVCPKCKQARRAEKEAAIMTPPTAKKPPPPPKRK